MNLFCSHDNVQVNELMVLNRFTCKFKRFSTLPFGFSPLHVLFCFLSVYHTNPFFCHTHNCVDKKKLVWCMPVSCDFTYLSRTHNLYMIHIHLRKYIAKESVELKVNELQTANFFIHSFYLLFFILFECLFYSHFLL